MSFLYCSWASDSKEPAEEEEDEKETSEDLIHPSLKKPFVVTPAKESKKQNGEESVQCNGDSESKEIVTNGEVKEDKVENKPPFFVMWKNPEQEEEVESDKDEDSDNENEQDVKENSKEELKPSESVITEEETKEEEKEKTLEEEPKPSNQPIFFSVWKDPNKEDEYVSSSSESEYEEDNDNSEINGDNDVNDNASVKSEKKDDDPPAETNGKDEEEDLFDSIAKSVSKNMTTLFCDYDDFEIKQNHSDDNDNYNDNDIGGVEMNGRDDFDALSTKSRSRSGSVRSMKSNKSIKDSDSESRRSAREKPKIKYDLLFTKPKPISKYFEPGTFLDKSLYKTHRCDVKIKKMKLQVRDWKSLLPPKKRKKNDQDEMPLSKRKKLFKTETKKPPKPRGTDSISKRANPVPVPATGYQPVCKYVCKQCPLCWNFWNVSQPFGQHVLNQTCQKTETRPMSTTDTGDKVFLSVHTATNKTDSYVATSHVPSLKLLCRGSLVGKNSTSDVAITVKEGLEYYHSLMWQGSAEDSDMFQYVRKMGRITIVSSMKQYEKLCRDPLKIAIYLEKKISRTRVKYGSKSPTTNKWVEKYNYFLKLPLHDMFLSITKDGYRVLEVPDSGKIRLVCLVCNNMTCCGCKQDKKKKLKEAQSIQKNKVKSKKKVIKKKVNNKKDNHKKKIKSKNNKHDDDAIGVPNLKLHKCKACKKYFKNVAALKSHVKACKVKHKKH